MKLGNAYSDSFYKMLAKMKGYIPNNRILSHLYYKLVSSDLAVGIDVEQDGLVSFLSPKNGDDIWDSPKRQEIKIGKLIDKIRLTDFTQNEIKEFVENWQILINQNKTPLDVVSGDVLKWSYLDVNTAGYGSCSRYSKCQPWLDIYTKNGVELVRVMKNGIVQARALVWRGVEVSLINGVEYTDEQKTFLAKYKTVDFMDRLYGVETSQALLKKWGIKQGMAMSGQARSPLMISFKEGVAPVNLKYPIQNDVDIAPFVDTFSWVDKSYFYNHPIKGAHRILRCPDGGGTVVTNIEDNEMYLQRLSNMSLESSSLSLYRGMLCD